MMTRGAWLTIKTTLGTMALVLASGGQAQERSQYSTAWMISQPLPAVLKTPVAEPATAGEMQVAHGDVFMAARLLPPTAARLTSDVLDEKGNLLIGKGSELFGLAAVRTAIFCTVQQRAPNAVTSLLIGNPGFSHTCLVDADGDRRFDSLFNARGQIKGLPNFAGRLPKSSKPAGGAGYETVDPATMRTTWLVGVEYRGNNNIMGNEIFDLVFGTADNLDKLTSRLMIKKMQVPHQLTVLGGGFTLLSSTGDTAKIRIDRPFAPLPFGVERVVKYSIY